MKRFKGCSLKFESETELSLENVEYIANMVRSYLRHIDQPDSVEVIPLEMEEIDPNEKI